MAGDSPGHPCALDTEFSAVEALGHWSDYTGSFRARPLAERFPWMRGAFSKVLSRPAYARIFRVDSDFVREHQQRVDRSRLVISPISIASLSKSGPHQASWLITES